MPIDVRLIISAQDRATRVLQGVGRSVGGLGNQFRQGGLAAGMMTGAIIGAGAAALKIASNIEQARIAFETMTGSVEATQKLLQELSDFAVKTPFDLPGVIAAAKQLMAMGSTVDTVIPDLKMLGDVAAGLSVPLWRLVINFGQVRAQGKLTGRELRDFAVAGVPLIDELAESLGVAKDEIAEMTRRGEIGFEDVRKVFIKMTSEGGKFEDLMTKQAKSFSGVMANVRDELIRMTAQIAGIAVSGEIREGSFFAVMKKAADALLISLQKLTPTLVKLSDWITKNKVVIFALAGAITAVLIVAIGALMATFGLSFVVLAKFMVIGALVGATIAALIESFNRARDTVKNWRDKLSRFFSETKSSAISNFEGMRNSIISVFDSIRNAIIGKVQEVKDFLSRNWATWGVRLQLPDFGAMFRRWQEGIPDWVRKRMEEMPFWLRPFAERKYVLTGGLQTGGIVPGTPGEAKLAVVHGGEKVIPHGVGETAGETKLEVHIHAGTILASKTEVREFAKMIYEELTNLARAQRKAPIELFNLQP